MGKTNDFLSTLFTVFVPSSVVVVVVASEDSASFSVAFSFSCCNSCLLYPLFSKCLISSVICTVFVSSFELFSVSFGNTGLI